MDKLLEIKNLQGLTDEETENLNRHITRKEVESVTKHLPAKKSSAPDDITNNFIHHL
jgi:hypothetical protein